MSKMISRDENLMHNGDVLARRLIRRSKKGVLSTIGRKKSELENWPLGSLVTFASAWDGSLIFLFSDLAQHTANLKADKRACFLIDGSNQIGNPQEGERVSILGTITPTNDKSIKRRFIARHPYANSYSNFDDFGFYNMNIEKIHYVGGFAQSFWFKGNRVILPKKFYGEIVSEEQEILQHINKNHKNHLQYLGNEVLCKRGIHWSMTGVDPDGVDLRCGESFYRVEFDEVVLNITDLQKKLSLLVGETLMIWG